MELALELLRQLENTRENFLGLPKYLVHHEGVSVGLEDEQDEVEEVLVGLHF